MYLPHLCFSTKSAPYESHVENVEFKDHPEMGPGESTGEWIRSD